MEINSNINFLMTDFSCDSTLLISNTLEKEKLAKSNA